VEDELQRVLRTVLGERDHDEQPLRLTVAGRTDRGVHAWGQVVSYRHEAVDPARLNRLLPDDVAVLSSAPAASGFDARHDAVSRTYCYRLLTRRARGVFVRGKALWWPSRLDRDVLDECARALLGRHDFTAFTPTETEHTHFDCRVLRAEWHPQGDLLELWIQAERFLRHMNRVLVGTMLEVASGRLAMEEFRALLEGAPREQAGPTAPAHGLALASVAYPADQAGWGEPYPGGTC
jgi:tRNA pseudouridine38-40 synthase